MKSEIFRMETKLNAPAATVYAWHEDPSALEQLSPESAGVEVVKPAALNVGEVALLRVPLVPNIFTVSWQAAIVYVKPGLEFQDRQLKGPFQYWHHRHKFVPTGSGCIMRDEVEFILPGGPAIHHLGKHFVQAQLREMFTYRHNQLLKRFGNPPTVNTRNHKTPSIAKVHPGNPILRYADGI